MRTFSISLLFFAFLSVWAVRRASADSAPDDSVTYSAIESHPAENVTVAVDAAGPRQVLSPGLDAAAKAGFLRVKVVVANDSAADISLKSVQLYMLIGAGARLYPVPVDEVYRRFVQSNGKNKPVLADLKSRLLPQKTVAPHARSEGYVFFDASGTTTPREDARIVLSGLHNTAPLADFTLALKPFSPAVSASPADPSSGIVRDLNAYYSSNLKFRSCMKELFHGQPFGASVAYTLTLRAAAYAEGILPACIQP